MISPVIMRLVEMPSSLCRETLVVDLSKRDYSRIAISPIKEHGALSAL
jgi:hypothetical protein